LLEQDLLPLGIDLRRRAQILERRAFGGDERPLITGGQEAGTEQRFAVPHVAVGHHDVSRQTAILAAQAVEHPRAGAGSAETNGPGMEEAQRRTVDKRVVITGANRGEVVRVLGYVLKDVGDLESGLAVLLEGTLRAHQTRLGRLHVLETQIHALEARWQ